MSTLAHPLAAGHAAPVSHNRLEARLRCPPREGAPFCTYDVARIHAVEALATLPAYRVVVPAGGAGPTVEALSCDGVVGVDALLEWPVPSDRTGARRYVFGVVESAEEVVDESGRRVELVIRPPLVRAALTTRSVVHVGASLRDILEATLRRHDGARTRHVMEGRVGAKRSWSFDDACDYERWCSLRVHASSVLHRPIAQCVQYEETDFAFLSRLLEDAGLTYWFEHLAGVSSFVIGDDAAAYVDVGAVGPGSASRRGKRLLPTRAALRAWSYVRPAMNLESVEPCAAVGVSGSDEFTAGEYTRSFDDPERGTERARVAADRVQSARAWHEGVIWSRRDLAAGQVCAYQPSADADPVRCLVTSVTIEANASVEPIFVARARFVPLDADLRAYRPARVTPRPRITGAQTAIVTAESFGADAPVPRCVRVRFEWDPGDPELCAYTSEGSSAWLRVSQPLAGASHGAMWSPREGDEVVVAFLDGDPDFPIVIGSVYDGATPDCWARDPLARWAGFMSCAPDGTPDEARMHLVALDHGEDPGIEVRAAGRLAVRVADDARTSVGGDAATTVDGGARLVVGGDARVAADGSLELGTARRLTLDAGDAIELRAGKVHVCAGLVVIDAGLVKASGAIKCDALIANSVIATTYTPGAGNIF